MVPGKETKKNPKPEAKKQKLFYTLSNFLLYVQKLDFKADPINKFQTFIKNKKLNFQTGLKINTPRLTSFYY